MTTSELNAAGHRNGRAADRRARRERRARQAHAERGRGRRGRASGRRGRSEARRVRSVHECRPARLRGDERTTSEGRVVLRFASRTGKLLVEVEDEGSGFELVTRASWEDGERAGRGLGMGLTIVRSVTDELEIESGGKGSRDRLLEEVLAGRARRDAAWRRCAMPSSVESKIAKIRSSSVISKILRMLGSLAGDRDLAPARAELPDHAHQDAERRRVEERRSGKVDQQRVAPRLDEPVERLLEPGSRVEVGLADHARRGKTVSQLDRDNLELHESGLARYPVRVDG